MVDRRLTRIEERLAELGVDDLAIAGFITVWNAASEEERVLLRALGDRRLLRLVKTLPAALRVAAETREESEAYSEAHGIVTASPVANVLRWVAGDSDRARLAVTVEEQQDHPRSTLLSGLLAVIEPA